jgi:putative hemolysin
MLLTFLTLVVGELAPKRIAMARAERWALLAARPLRGLGAISRPAVWLLGVSTDAVVRLAGVRADEQKEDVSDEELRDLLLTRSGFRPQRDILEGALDVGDRVLREILVPRRNVTTVATDATVDEAIAALRRGGHSRAPLCDDLDQVGGVVHLKDLAGAEGRAAAVAREAMYLPETLPVLDALRALQQRRQSLAVVVDEYGGGAGIVSLEDVLEEIVGEIYDEFDRDHQSVVRTDDGSILLKGSFPLHELADIGVTLPDSEATTVAGVLLEHLGRVPAAGDEVTVGDWRLLATEADERTVQRVRLEPRPAGEQPPQD